MVKGVTETIDQGSAGSDNAKNEHKADGECFAKPGTLFRLRRNLPALPRKDGVTDCGKGFCPMETGVIVAISVVLFIAVFAVLVCIFGSVAGTVSAVKHTNDEDTNA